MKPFLLSRSRKGLLALGALALLLGFGQAPQARAQENPVTPLTALSNLAQLKNYKAQQSVYGSFEFSEDVRISGQYRLSVNSSVNKSSLTKGLQHSRVSLFVTLKGEADEAGEKPFDSVTVNASGEMIGVDDTDLYLRLADLNVSAQGLKGSDQQGLSTAVESFQKAKGQWLHLSLADSLSQDPELSAMVEGFLESLKNGGEDLKAGLEGFFESILDEAVAEGGMSEEEKSQAMAAFKSFWSARLFYQRPILSGPNQGMTFFSLNKAALLGWAESSFGLAEEEMAEIKRIAPGFSLGGMYRIAGDLMDTGLIRFGIKMPEEGVSFSMATRFRVSDIGKASTVSVPTQFIEMMTPEFIELMQPEATLGE